VAHEFGGQQRGIIGDSARPGRVIRTDDGDRRIQRAARK
jgi:hypothetical protein